MCICMLTLMILIFCSTFTLHHLFRFAWLSFSILSNKHLYLYSLYLYYLMNQLLIIIEYHFTSSIDLLNSHLIYYLNSYGSLVTQKYLLMWNINEKMSMIFIWWMCSKLSIFLLSVCSKDCTYIDLRLGNGLTLMLIYIFFLHGIILLLILAFFKCL